MGPFALHGSLTDYALLLIGLAYVVSLLRDWRPIRSLRSENRDLRGALEQSDRRCAALETRCAELEGKCAALEKSRDFQTSFAEVVRAIDQARADTTHEHEKLLGALDGIVHELGELGKGIAQNTAATAALAAGINAGTVS